MLEVDRELREPWLFPPTQDERLRRQQLDQRNARRRSYFASKRVKEVKDEKA